MEGREKTVVCTSWFTSRQEDIGTPNSKGTVGIYITLKKKKN